MGYWWQTVTGGKLDDITVLVSTVVAPGPNKAALAGAASAAEAGLEPVKAQLASGLRILKEKVRARSCEKAAGRGTGRRIIRGARDD